MTRGVHHHTCLEHRGGAVRVARMLEVEQAAAGVEVSRSFEVAETRPGEAELAREGWTHRLESARDRGAVIHLHTSGDWAGVLGFLARRPGPLVVTMHDCRLFTGGCAYPLDCPELARGCRGACPQGFARASLVREKTARALCDADPVLVSPSAWLAGEFAAHGPGAGVRVVPNGVPWPHDPLPGNRARALIGFPTAVPLALFSAHGSTRAGYKSGDRWLDLWAAIRKQAPGACCFMVGGERTEQRGDVFFWPWVDEGTMRSFMAAADVNCHPSRADNHPLTVLEAASTATATAAFAVGGVVEQITRDTGFLVRPGDEAGLARTAAGLLADRAAARAMGRAAFDHGRERFSAERMAADYQSVYAGV
jgi:glycosyltransferase involved in cell wall biosynthesis